MKLNNQEIRNCIYTGGFNLLLRELDKYPAWRRINKMRTKQQYRFTKQEIILRFFAFYDRAATYEGQLAKFLNSYMHENQNPPWEFLEVKRTLFKQTLDCISGKVFGEGNPPKLSVTVLEAMLVAVAKNIDTLAVETPTELHTRYETLIQHPAFSENSLKEGLSKKPRVIGRLQTAERIFADQ